MRPHSRLFHPLLLAFLFLALMGGAPSTHVGAMPLRATAYELIEAVNNLRAKNGLPAYSINSILMSVAQSHSDYQASISSVTHYGPGGTRPYQRALAAGYSVAGDLSLGGFFSENILAGSGYSARDVVNVWMGDAPHQNTMLSANLTEVGAGVSCSGNYCYFTLDAAQPSGASAAYTPPSGGTTGGTGAAIPTIGVVLPSTPNADGSIQHVVQPGETLWSISIAYHVNFEEIRRLNKISDNLIYPGDTLIIQVAASTATAGPTGTPTIAATFTPFIFWTTTASPPPSPTLPPSAPLADGSGWLAAGVIIAAALVAAGALTAAGARKK
ncbi:MAG: hypothetical protein HFACDABA_01874 [Anaerolineales bacterium]|nr:hypothetical protein [Anaerolineales bacterium]